MYIFNLININNGKHFRVKFNNGDIANKFLSILMTRHYDNIVSLIDIIVPIEDKYVKERF